MIRPLTVAILAASLATAAPAHAAGLQQTGGVWGGGWAVNAWNGFRAAVSPTFRAQRSGSAYMQGARAVDLRHSTTGHTTVEQNDRALARAGQAHRISDRTRREEALAAENMVESRSGIR